MLTEWFSQHGVYAKLIREKGWGQQQRILFTDVVPWIPWINGEMMIEHINSCTVYIYIYCVYKYKYIYIYINKYKIYIHKWFIQVSKQHSVELGEVFSGWQLRIPASPSSFTKDQHGIKTPSAVTCLSSPLDMIQINP